MRTRPTRQSSHRCPKDVNPALFEEMLDLAPQGAVLERSYTDNFWRVFRFRIEAKPSRESGLKQGDTFELSLPLLFKGDIHA